jgi:hypothetical protein
MMVSPGATVRLEGTKANPSWTITCVSAAAEAVNDIAMTVDAMMVEKTGLMNGVQGLIEEQEKSVL